MTNPSPATGDHDAAHDHDHGQCDCSISNAREVYALVSALAAAKGVTFSDSGDEGDEEDAHAEDLRLIADLAVAHGADPDDFDDDEDDMDDEDEGEPGDEPAHEVHQFSASDDDLDSADSAIDQDDEGNWLNIDVSDLDEPDDDKEIVGFRDWPKAKRDETPDEDFGDPAAKLFPVTDQGDLDSAAHLVGKAKNPGKVKDRLIAIAKRKGLTLPASWVAEMSGDLVASDDDGSCVFWG